MPIPLRFGVVSVAGFVSIGTATYRTPCRVLCAAAQKTAGPRTTQKAHAQAVGWFGALDGGAEEARGSFHQRRLNQT
jgi:hypothetical protein